MTASPLNTDASVEVRKAVRFFWAWLILATSLSIAGNVTHAILKAPEGAVILAAVAAVVPPVILLGSTHSATLLIKTRRLGWTFVIALTLTIALAGCAFALSFDALRDLAVMLGMRPDRAYLWPVAIDVSIANSTLALLSFTPPRRAAQNGVPAASPQAVDTRPVGEPHTVGSHRNEAVPVRPAGVSLERREVVSSGSAVAAGASVSRQVGVGRPLSAVPDDVAAGAEVGAVAAPAAIVEWRPKAEELVQAGVTQKDPETVARILAERAAGTPPSTIGRRLEVHHSTVGRILAAADENIDESLQPEPAAL